MIKSDHFILIFITRLFWSLVIVMLLTNIKIHSGLIVDTVGIEMKEFPMF